jgi:hypothetical protein
VERRGFEPLTSAVQARARLTGSSLPPSAAARRQSRRQLEPALAPRLFQRPVRRQRLERLAGLDENRRVAGRGLKAPHDHIDVERIELDAAADATDLVGRDEGRARAKERVDDDVAAVGEIEKGVLAYMLKLRDRVVLETSRNARTKKCATCVSNSGEPRALSTADQW